MPGGPAAASLFLVPSRSRWVADEVQLAHRTLDLQKMTQARTETGVDPKFLDRQYLDTEKVRRTEGHTRNRAGGRSGLSRGWTRELSYACHGQASHGVIRKIFRS